jgi:hypothetical protein
MNKLDRKRSDSFIRVQKYNNNNKNQALFFYPKIVSNFFIKKRKENSLYRTKDKRKYENHNEKLIVKAFPFSNRYFIKQNQIYVDYYVIFIL